MNIRGYITERIIWFNRQGLVAVVTTSLTRVHSFKCSEFAPKRQRLLEQAQIYCLLSLNPRDWRLNSNSQKIVYHKFDSKRI